MNPEIEKLEKAIAELESLYQAGVYLAPEQYVRLVRLTNALYTLVRAMNPTG